MRRVFDRWLFEEGRKTSFRNWGSVTSAFLRWYHDILRARRMPWVCGYDRVNKFMVRKWAEKNPLKLTFVEI
jgi:hypothetical protein